MFKIPNVRNKEGALELSVGTIVILVIGMTMLILGIVLVRTIFTGATQSVDVINDNVRAEINELFSDNTKKVVINLPDNHVDIPKGERFGIAFGIRNTRTGVSGSERFSYTIRATDVQTGCQLDVGRADSYITLNSQGSADLAPGSEPQTLRFVITPPDNAPLCDINYQVEVRDGSNQAYATEQFIVSIVGR